MFNMCTTVKELFFLRFLEEILMMMIQISIEIDMSQFLINLIKREFLSCKIKGHKTAEKC